MNGEGREAGAEDTPAEGFRRRRDGFTAAKRKAFVEALARFGNVRDACRVAGVSNTTFYRHEKRDQDFASLCRAARAQAAGNLETLAWERAVTGIEEPVIAYGKVVAVRRRRSDAVFRMLLQASNPEKFGRMGGLRRAEIERELRAKIVAEEDRKRRPRIATNEEVTEALLKRLAVFAARVRAERGEAEGGSGGSGGGDGSGEPDPPPSA